MLPCRRPARDRDRRAARQLGRYAGQSVAADQAQAMPWSGWTSSSATRPTIWKRLSPSYASSSRTSGTRTTAMTLAFVRARQGAAAQGLSQRLDLVFSDSDGDSVDREEKEDQDNISLQYRVREGDRSRFDATMGFSSGHLKPGVRYRNEGELQSARSYRYVQRLQYEDGENFFTIAQGDLYQAFENTDVLRWSNRLKYGDHTQGMEWRTRLSLFQRYKSDTKRPLALESLFHRWRRDSARFLRQELPSGNRMASPGLPGLLIRRAGARD